MSSRTQSWSIITFILLTAAFFRFHGLADVPPGLFFDPAINGLDALRIIERGGLTLFFPTNGGRESLLIYGLAAVTQLFGTNPLTPRLIPAAASLLTVAAIYPLLHYNTRRHTAHFAALTAALSMWHVTVSRMEQRPVIIPLLATLTFAFFLRGYRRAQTRDFILAGMALGLGFYFYSAARLIPVILVIAILPEITLKPTKSKPLSFYAANLKVWTPLVTLTASALLTASPMLGYFWFNPAQFTTRAASVMVWQFLPNNYEIITELGRNTLRVIGFLGYAGSPNPLFGLQPGLSLLLTPFLLIGLGVALKNSRDIFHRLMATWWLIGLIPSIIAIESPHPLRLIVALVPTAVLVGLGMGWVLQQLSQPHRFYLPIIIYSLITLNLYQTYFLTWANLKVTQATFDNNAVVMAQAIKQLPPDKPLYLPLSRYNDSPLLYYLGDTFSRQTALSVTLESGARLISPDKNRHDAVWVRLYQHTATLLPPMNDRGLQIIQSALTTSTAQVIASTDGEVVARWAELPLDPAQFIQTPTQPLSATFGQVQLVAATYPTIITSTDVLPVTLYWQTTTMIPDEYEILVHLVNDQRQAFGHGDARPNDWVYPTTFWQPNGEIIPAQHLIQLNTPLSPGRYRLAVAVFNPVTQQRLPLTSGLSDSLDTYFIGPLKVALPPPPATPRQPLSATFGTAIQLQGYEIERDCEVANERDCETFAYSPIRLFLHWQALAIPDRDYTVFIHLLDESGNLVAGQDSQPFNGQYPTSIWSPQEQLLDVHTLTLPPNLPKGQYHVTIGLYHQPTGQRLFITLHNGEVVAGGELELGVIEPK